MDRKGQSAVLFIILIPVFLLIAGLVVDMGINIYNEKKIKNVTEDVLINLLENNVEEDKIKDKAILIYDNNNIDTEYLQIEKSYGDKITIINSNEYYSFMNSILNKGNGKRQTIVEASGYIDNGQVIITFEGEIYED